MCYTWYYNTIKLKAAYIGPGPVKPGPSHSFQVRSGLGFATITYLMIALIAGLSSNVHLYHMELVPGLQKNRVAKVPYKSDYDHLEAQWQAVGTSRMEPPSA